MNNEIIQASLQRLDEDRVVQSLIAQANARYILLNTSEESRNFPPYTIQDDNLNVLAFHYLNLGCSYAENQLLGDAIAPLEKGASILEAVHAPLVNQKATSNYYGVIASMAYYVGFQYSKAFILITKFEATTVIGRMIRYFLQRNFRLLNDTIYTILLDSEHQDSYLAEQYEEDLNNNKIYESIIARALDGFVKFYESGDNDFLQEARALLINGKEIAALEGDPGIWWIVRLLLLISDGFNEASLWNVLSGYFDTEDIQVRNYIRSLVFMEPRGIYELFLTQRKSLAQVLDMNAPGCVVSIPTSSGKTRIAEIAILHGMQQNPDGKILYIAPFRSLAFEVESNLERVFEHSNIAVSHLYGGSLYSKLDELAIEEAQVIIATPEKAKAILRGNNDLANQISLTIIDEGHLLGDNKRLIMNEIFYEELRYYIEKNNGRFLLLSAVLPNADDIATWLTGTNDTVYRENWRPSDERLGILEWNNGVVNLNWESQDKERASFNRRFIVAEQLPRVKYQRKNVEKYFPEDKNDAVAATAYKLRSFGPVLIFVGLKASVFVMANSYLRTLGADSANHPWKSRNDWRAFELACIEAYGENNGWLNFARKGILCHNADLHGDVRLPLERLMRSDRPLVIISTSTLGQGVNLGVSTVIFSTLFQSGSEITARDFWNIAGRAGRAYVDHEGKILVALDTNGMNRRRREEKQDEVRAYFDKGQIDLAQSGILSLIETLKDVAEDQDTDFDLLIQLITENRVDEIGEKAEAIEDILDWIDDTLLSLLLVNNPDGPVDVSWTENFFRRSLAAIQADKSETISAQQVAEFLTARVEGIAEKVGANRNKWFAIVQSGLPLNSDLSLEEKLPVLTGIVQAYLLNDESIATKINMLRDIEEEIRDVNVFADDRGLFTSDDIDAIRTRWLTGTPISGILSLDHALDVITKLYTFSLPWVLNGISKKLLNHEFEAEAEAVEELAILVEAGLPSIEKVKIYQAGIRSRAAANELGDLLDGDFVGRSISEYKRELVNNKDNYDCLVSASTGEWLDTLSRNAKSKKTIIKAIPNFTFDDVHERTRILVAKKINGKQYLMSPDRRVIQEDNGNIDFSEVNELPGITFIYSRKNEIWRMKNDNPYVQVNK
ncbi:DEAD/DEAH box helicase [Arachidicoccus sp.]|uniref:DEAD/DEAH box helicase n=1 Tax=Arachidicoccus sp. TaxID=1872624 RepID=UPI003D221CB6